MTIVVSLLRYYRRHQVFVICVSLLILSILSIGYYLHSGSSLEIQNDRIVYSKDVQFKNIRGPMSVDKPILRRRGDHAVNLSLIAVHLDLKGAPPTMKFYEKFFPFLSSLGVNGLLVEYEDMFPYMDELSPLRAHNSYSRKNIKRIQKMAKIHGLQFIPLVQTFGHVEFALKGEKFASLRELDHYPNMVCPSKTGSFDLVKKIVGQIMNLHPDIKYLHIGSDETWQLGQCELCKQKMMEKRWNTTDLFFHHVIQVASYIKQTFDINILIWDDMFRKVGSEYLKKWNLGEYLEPVVWNYHAWNFDSGNPTWESYSDVFRNVWAASAFKGATGADAMVTNITHHMTNHLNWLDVFRRYQPLWKMKGGSFDKIIITGWQRYNHFASLCELLPAGIPSLTMCLQVLKDGKFDPDETIPAVENRLGFPLHSLVMDDSKRSCSPLNFQSALMFPSGDAFMNIYNWCALSTSISDFLTLQQTQGWASIYNQKHRYSSPFIFEDAVEPALFKAMIFQPETLIERLNMSLSELYDTHTVKEWIETNVHPIMTQLNGVRDMMKDMANKMFWPRQPLD